MPSTTITVIYLALISGTQAAPHKGGLHNFMLAGAGGPVVPPHVAALYAGVPGVTGLPPHIAALAATAVNGVIPAMYLPMHLAAAYPNGLPTSQLAVLAAPPPPPGFGLPLPGVLPPPIVPGAVPGAVTGAMPTPVVAAPVPAPVDNAVPPTNATQPAATPAAASAPVHAVRRGLANTLPASDVPANAPAVDTPTWDQHDTIKDGEVDEDGMELDDLLEPYRKPTAPLYFNRVPVSAYNDAFPRRLARAHRA